MNGHICRNRFGPVSAVWKLYLQPVPGTGARQTHGADDHPQPDFRRRPGRRRARNAGRHRRHPRIPCSGSRRYRWPSRFCAISAPAVVHVHTMDFFADFLALTRPWHRKPLVLFYPWRLLSHRFRIPFQSSISAAYPACRWGVTAPLSFTATATRDRSSGCATTADPGGKWGRYRQIREQRARRCAYDHLYFGRLAPDGAVQLINGSPPSPHRPALAAHITGKPRAIAIEQLKAVAHNERSAVVEFHDSPSDTDLSALIARSSVFRIGQPVRRVRLARSRRSPRSIRRSAALRHAFCNKLRLGTLCSSGRAISPAPVA